MDFAICPVFKAPRGHGYPNHGSSRLCLFRTHSMWHHMGIILIGYPFIHLWPPWKMQAHFTLELVVNLHLFVGKKWKKMENRWGTTREEVFPRMWSAENQGKQGLGKQGFFVHVTACHPGVWLTATTLSEGVVSTLHRAEGTRLPSEFTWDLDGVSCRLLAGPEHTQNFYMFVFQRKGEQRDHIERHMFWDGDLPLWSPKGQGLLQGFKGPRTTAGV